MSLVVTHDLHKTFVHHGRPLHVLRGVSIEIGQGEMVAIVGSSGAGKSTLMHCIGTLDLPSKGTIKLGPHQLAGLPGAQLAKIRNETIGFVFQFHHLLPEFDALENVMMPGLIQGRPRKEMVALASKLLDEVGLSKRETHRPSELSGGEQQRVALARALVLNPKLILADEPTGNLDSATSAAIQRLFFEVNDRHGTTIVVVTHDPGFAQLMPRVITLKDGEVESDERRAGYRGAPKPAAATEPTAAKTDVEPDPVAAAASEGT
jgi:lipoprotein-releasing system ATP-binding protein